MPKSFEELMNTPLEEVKPLPILPMGSYLVGIMGPPEEILSAQKQTPGREYRLKVYQARGDVDQAALTKILEEHEMSISDFELRDTFYITPGSMDMYKRFLVNTLGIPASMNTRQAEAETSGKQFLIHIRHRPRQDGSGLRAEISDRKPAD